MQLVGLLLGIEINNKIISTPQRPHLVNFSSRLDADTLINMLFRTKTKQTQEDEKTKPVFKDEKGNVYPTGFKLWLLMASLFVSMFLVSLVRLG